MGFAFLKRIFGSAPQESGALPPIVHEKSQESQCACHHCHADKADSAAAAPCATISELPSEVQDAVGKVQTFVDYVVKALVDQPEQVSMTFVQKSDLSVLQIHCFKKDIGKIIGKQGKTISSLRLLVNGIGARYGHRVTVDVMDD